jgi:mono/diheme cytochrome c family protein
MPAWQGTLSEEDIDTLAAYVTNPTGRPAGEVLFGQHCTACHGARVPSSPDMVTARKVIRGGGAHVTMPVWGEILTPEQLEALVQFTLTSAQGGGGTQQGARLFADNCAVCHGQFGQGGPNPVQAGDLLSPISTTEYLGTRDDTTLRNVISQGQPDLGMSPFGSAFGGPLDDEQIDALIAYMRSWQTNPPQVSPPAAPTAIPADPGADAPAGTTEPKFSEHVLPILAANCQMCHNSSIKLGGWDASSHESVTTTGNNAPAVIPGDAENSLLARLIQGVGGPLMPPGGKLPEEQIRLILDWIAAGAKND